MQKSLKVLDFSILKVLSIIFSNLRQLDLGIEANGDLDARIFF